MNTFPQNSEKFSLEESQNIPRKMPEMYIPTTPQKKTDVCYEATKNPSAKKQLKRKNNLVQEDMLVKKREENIKRLLGYYYSLLDDPEWCFYFLEDIFQRFDKAQRYFKELKGLFREINNLKYEMQNYECDEASLCKKLLEIEAGLKAQLSCLHTALTTNAIPQNFKEPILEKAMASVEDKIFHIPGVKIVALQDENIPLVAQFPSLWSQYPNYQNTPGGYPFPAYSLAEFEKEIEYQCDLLDRKNWSLCASRLYHFSYIHTYQTVKNSMIDNDNRDTKIVTDIICATLGTTDHPLSVSFSSHTKVCENLPTGSYLIVYNGEEKQLKICDEIAFLIAYFCVKN